MKVIGCNVHLFAFQQNIYLIDTETGVNELLTSVPLAKVPETIAALCQKLDIDEVRVAGIPTVSKKVATSTKVEYSRLYSNRELKIEVM